MKILYDYQAFEKQNYGGISRYFYELIIRLSKDENHDFVLPLAYSSNEYIKTFSRIADQLIGEADFYRKFAWGNNFRGKIRLFNIQQKLLSGFNTRYNANRNLSLGALKDEKYDLFHPTYYETYHTGYRRNIPLVITVHDMIHELYPEYFPKNDPTAANKKLLCEKADRIIAVSENTKNDLVNLLNIPEEKIKVIYHGSSLMVKPVSPLLQQPYLLYVGNRSSYKNFKFCVNAIAPLMKELSLQLVCCGGVNFKKEEIDFFTGLNIADHLLYFPGGDENLTSLYQHAAAFIFPSRYEGFGIPVLEALACNCPCILSSGGSLPEIAGDAALYFDPENAASLQAGVKKILHDESLRKKLKEKGAERSAEFSWDRTYSQTIELYQNCL